MTKIGIGYVSHLTRLLNEIPDKRKRVSLEESMEMRRALAIGLLEASRFLRKCSSVSEAIDLYHKIKRRLVEMEEEEMIELNRIYNEDCLEGMKRIPDGAIHCVITSPPYNVDLGNNKYNKFGYGQHEDDLPHEEYLRWMKSVFQECYRVLSNDGRICVNIGDGRNGKIPTHADFIYLLRKMGFKPITTIIWNKNNTSNRCAWGSYLSAKAPSFPRSFEYILVFGKSDSLERNGETTVTKEEWKQYTNGLWTFSPEKYQKKIGHPAMFPVELPRRLIQMITYKNDVILDPFMGSGTTAIAAIRTKRNFIGFELQKEYFDIACKRVREERMQLSLF